jgi:RNA polymerase sigma-70 factor (ECF subfamily)
VDALTPFPDLLQRLREGDAAAWEEFHRRYEPLVRRVARRWLTPSLRRQADSVDVVQSVFRTALSGVAGTPFENEGRLIAWLSTVARHRVSRLGRRERGPGDAHLGPLDEERLDLTAGLPPPEAAARAEEIHRLKTTLDRLPPAERECVLLRDFEGLGFEEIAKRLERPSADAARKLHDRACSRIASWLEAPPT